jgi:subtilase family serine protease
LLKNRRRGAFALFVSVLAAVIVAALVAASGRPSAASAGTMTPAVGSSALFQSVGQPLANANGTVAFGCQTTVPAGCYGPDQIRAAYGIQPLLDHGINGTGRTIAIVDSYGSPTIDADLANFDSVWGLPAPPSFQVVAPFGVDPTDPDNASGWAGETSLDVEWAHAIAPNANIVLVVAKSNNDSDILDATQWISDHNAGDVLSQSYGEAEQCMAQTDITRQHKLFAKMSKQGITLLASSGDQGAGQPTCDGSAYFKAVSTPASDPYVTGVGGTDLIADGTSGAYQSESVWNESEIFGDAVAGGGGVSVLYSRPSYQSSVQHTKMRTVPDVSYNAAVYNGVIVSFGGLFYRFGGTSAGSPQWAGITALADQIAHKRLGQLNPAMYQTRGSRLFFHDVTMGDNSIPDLTPYQGESFGTPIDGYSAGKGYDYVTGLGTPRAATLAPYLAIHGLLSDNDFGSIGSSHGGGNGHHGHKRDH